MGVLMFILPVFMLLSLSFLRVARGVEGAEADVGVLLPDPDGVVVVHFHRLLILAHNFFSSPPASLLRSLRASLLPLFLRTQSPLLAG